MHEFQDQKCSGMTTQLSRRLVLKSLAAGGVAATFSACKPVISLATEKDDAKSGVDFGFSLYGMRSLKVADAIKTCASIGYDCVELVAIEGWPCDPASLSAS